MMVDNFVLLIQPVVDKSIFLSSHLFFWCFVGLCWLKHLGIHKRIRRNMQCKETNLPHDVLGTGCPLWLRLVGSHYLQRKRERPQVSNWFVFEWGSRIVRRSDQMELGISFCQGLLSGLWGLFPQWQVLGRDTFVGSFPLQLSVSQMRVLPYIATSWSSWYSIRFPLFFVWYTNYAMASLNRVWFVWSNVSLIL